MQNKKTYSTRSSNFSLLFCSFISIQLRSLDTNSDDDRIVFAGLYPLAGWRIGKELVYVVEGASNDTGTLVEWVKALGKVLNQRFVRLLAIQPFPFCGTICDTLF